MVLMIFNIPYTYFDFWFDYALSKCQEVRIVLVLHYIRICADNVRHRKCDYLL